MKRVSDRRTSVRGLLQVAFAVLCLLNVAGLLVWAVSSVNNPLWEGFPGFYGTGAWWPIPLQLALGVTALLVYYLPRHARGRDWSTSAVIALLLSALVLGMCGFWNCATGASPFWGPAGATLGLLGGNIEWKWRPGCPVGVPLGIQAAALFARLGIALVAWEAISLVFRSQIDRVLARHARSVLVVTDFGTEAAPFLHYLKRGMAPRQRIVVLDEEGSDATRRLARELGARVVTLDLSDPTELKPYLVGRGWLARQRRLKAAGLYLLSPDASVNLARLELLRQALKDVAVQTRGELPPRLLLRMDDPVQAEDWRRRWMSGADEHWMLDVVSACELGAEAAVARARESHIRQFAISGDSRFAIALLNSLAQWRREDVATRGVGSAPYLSVALVGRHAKSLKESFERQQSHYGNREDELNLSFAGLDSSVEELGDEWVPDTKPWVLVLSEESEERGTTTLERASALAARHPDWLIWAWDREADGLGMIPAMADLFLLGPTLWVRSGQPVDVWEWFGRILHQRYLNDYLDGCPEAGHPSRGDWDDDLSTITKDSNMRQVAQVLNRLPEFGKSFTASAQLGDFLDPAAALSGPELEKLARGEHASWRRHHEDHGWSFSPERKDERRRHPDLVPWEVLDEAGRDKARKGVGNVLEILAVLGYRLRSADAAEVVGHPGGAVFVRRGRVTAMRQSAPWSWKTAHGDEMHGTSGDWLLHEGNAESWSVADPIFRQSYRHVSGDEWERTGTVHARQVSVAETVLTREGVATAHVKDWVVTGSSGDQWVVEPEKFGRFYERPAMAEATTGRVV